MSSRLCCWGPRSCEPAHHDGALVRPRRALGLVLTPVIILASPLWLPLVACGAVKCEDVLRLWGFCAIHLKNSMAVQMIINGGEMDGLDDGRLVVWVVVVGVPGGGGAVWSRAAEKGEARPKAEKGGGAKGEWALLLLSLLCLVFGSLGGGRRPQIDPKFFAHRLRSIRSRDSPSPRA